MLGGYRPARAVAIASSSRSVPYSWTFNSRCVSPISSRSTHGDRIGLFAGGAAGDPDAHAGRRRPCRPAAWRRCSCLQRLEGGRVTEELRDVDQQFAEQGLHLGRVVVRRSAHRRSASSMPCWAMRRSIRRPMVLFLYRREVVPGLPRSNCRILSMPLPAATDSVAGADRWTKWAGARPQRLRHLLDLQHLGRIAAVDRARRHAVVLGRLRILHQAQAAGARDRAQAQRAVAAGARQDDAHRGLAPGRRRASAGRRRSANAGRAARSAR